MKHKSFYLALLLLVILVLNSACSALNSANPPPDAGAPPDAPADPPAPVTRVIPEKY